MRRVTVVLPTRNRRDRVERALASVDAQDFRDVEIVVVDDGSTDGTVDWLRARRPDVHVLAGAHAGAAAARNRGVAHARGELVAFLDDDDRWQPEYLAAQVASLDSSPGAAASYAGVVEIDAAGRRRRPASTSPLRDADELERLLASCFIHTMSAVVCRRAAFERYGLFDEELAVVHDLDWYARVLSGGGQLLHAPTVLVERSVPGGLVSRHRPWSEEERDVIARVLAGRPGARRRVQACRSLYFAKLALARGDVGFGAARLAEAIALAPTSTVQIAAARLFDRRSWRPAEAA
jgi:glycosyltransferase involved in cell wall biosynthesis